MTRPSLATAAAAAGCSLVLLLTGCGSGDAPAGGGSLERRTTPLDDYLSGFWETVGGQDEGAVQVAVEESTAACMREQGFDHTPRAAAQGSPEAAADEDVDWGSLEFAREYGYGIVTNPVTGGDALEQPVDANADYVASMSEAEEAAYFQALFGTAPELDADDPETEDDWQDGGCAGRAQHEASEATAILSEPDTLGLFDEISSLYQSVQTGPEMAERNAAWSECFADAGHDGFTTPAEPRTAIVDQLGALYATGTGGEPDLEGAAELREEEVDTAVADLTCQRDTGYVQALEAVQFPAEERFIETHRAELDAMVEAAAQGGE